MFHHCAHMIRTATKKKQEVSFGAWVRLSVSVPRFGSCFAVYLFWGGVFDSELKQIN